MPLYKIDFESLNLTHNKLYESMGYRGNIPDAIVADRTVILLRKASDIVKPQCYFALFDGELGNDNIFIDHCRFLVGKTIAHLMNNSTQYAVFTATAGSAFQDWYEELASIDIIDAFIVDSIGSCIAESAGDYMELMLENQIGELNHTNRFSPGYCGWNLVQQRDLFSLLPPHVCGITLNDSCLMNPIKSISGVLGIGEKVKEKIYSCDICDKSDCFKRISNRISYIK